MKQELIDLKDITVAVTKNRSLEEIRKVYDCGFRMFGENRVQELLKKKDCQLEGVQWHMIGHLQTNKVRAVVETCALIHSVDSIKLLLKVAEEAKRIGKVQDVLLQVNVAEEESKFGFTVDEVYDVMRKYHDLSGVRIRGIMVIGPNTDDKERIREVFSAGKLVFDKLESSYQAVDILSMGMSNDYEIALQEGASMLRLGRILFEDDFQ
ncbi:MAG: YggS family pyridoxal phosphate-dependent enzyme [Erysipelotrichaceae bacterium]|nr:YggS family pyridoxal phosphate-dependent enzyme [Erysipelotrichaceae bacterium]